jgi:DNA-binding XRE family transcriptional regulator
MATVSRRENVVNKGGAPRTREPSALGKKIDSRLEKIGMTRPELAKAVGIGYVSMHHIIHGVNQPRLETAKKICDALGVSLSSLFD